MLDGGMRFRLPLYAACALLTLCCAVPARAQDAPLESKLRVNIPRGPGGEGAESGSMGGNAKAPDGRMMVERIAAIVNDDIITATDLSNRLSLAFFASGLPPTQENQQKLVPQVLRGMIDEQLQRQEAKRQGATVESAEVDHAVGGLADQNHMPAEQLPQFLASHGVKVAALRQQVEASLLWSKVVQRELRPQVDVGDEEIDGRLAEIAANAGKPEYLVAEIFLRIDSATDESQVQTFAQGLEQQLQSGTSFAALAQQFSQGAGALQGGDLGWIRAGQLSPELDRVLLSLNKGEASAPIRDAGGIHILLLRDQRLAAGADPSQVHLQLQQISVPMAAGESDDQLLARATAAHDIALATAKGCSNLSADLAAKAPSGVPAATAQALDVADLSALPNWLAATVQNMAVGQVSDPVAVDGGAAMVALCNREQPAGTLPSRDEVLNQIGTERLELAARRLMRDLRREAVIDIRVGRQGPAMATDNSN